MKQYVKDASGKYRLVDKPNPIVAINQQRLLTLEELDGRLKRLELIVIGPRK